jgi:hypothetical protein
MSNQSTVTITEVGGKWRLEGTTYINNDASKPWNFSFEVNSEEEANKWVEKHNLQVVT